MITIPIFVAPYQQLEHCERIALMSALVEWSKRAQGSQFRDTNAIARVVYGQAL